MVAAHAESAHIPSSSNAGSAAVRLCIRGSLCISFTKAARGCMQRHRFLVFVAGIFSNEFTLSRYKPGNRMPRSY